MGYFLFDESVLLYDELVLEDEDYHIEEKTQPVYVGNCKLHIVGVVQFSCAQAALGKGTFGLDVRKIFILNVDV
jgi:hypothetical protein